MAFDMRAAAKNDYGMPPEVIEAFTCGDCWALAIEIGRLSAWTVVTIAHKGEPDEWRHVAVRTPEGMILDVQGAWELSEWGKFWSYAVGDSWELTEWTATSLWADCRKWKMELQWDEIVPEGAQKVLGDYRKSV